MSKYQELQELVASYGEATILLINESRRFGQAIIDGFPDYLGCEKHRVKGVPPQGEVNVNARYQDDIFSFYHKNPNFLEPVTMGFYVEVANKIGRGATWVIFGVEFWLSGQDVIITVAGKDQRAIALPRVESPDLTRVFEVLFDEVRSEFSVDLDASRERPRIGFTGREKLD
ncbi:hypothetical protein [Mesorhizobium sp. M0187]|uniref:hypothetical protein n=1 Tax=Mesorhizobium sp. M0187 TaxID=2956908 RepID=UPI003337DBB8